MSDKDLLAAHAIELQCTACGEPVDAGRVEHIIFKDGRPPLSFFSPAHNQWKEGEGYLYNGPISIAGEVQERDFAKGKVFKTDAKMLLVGKDSGTFLVRVHPTKSEGKKKREKLSAYADYTLSLVCDDGSITHHYMQRMVSSYPLEIKKLDESDDSDDSDDDDGPDGNAGELPSLPRDCLTIQDVVALLSTTAGAAQFRLQRALQHPLLITPETAHFAHSTYCKAKVVVTAQPAGWVVTPKHSALPIEDTNYEYLAPLLPEADDIVNRISPKVYDVLDAEAAAVAAAAATGDAEAGPLAAAKGD